jgi:bla regulator protein BlaR1
MTPWLSSALVNHLWQSTLFVVVVWLATLALRSNRARVRYWLWAAASVKFLIPVSALISLGAQFEWRTAPAIAQPAASFVMEQVLAPPVMAAAVPATAMQDGSVLPWLLLGVWLAGSAAVLLSWRRQWIPVRSALREGTPLKLDQQYDTGALRVWSSPSMFEPAVIGIRRPVLLLPEGLLDRLTHAQVHALIAHERCHVRCHDNLAAAVHMAAEAIFWFHPLVWWIERRMIDERERACDEAVLHAGGQPADYAEGILTVCRFTVESPLVCVAGIAGSDLRHRIESIMRRELGRPMTIAGRLVLALTATATISAPLVAGMLQPPAAAEQDAQKPGARVAFEVASVRPNNSGDPRQNIQTPPGGRFNATNVRVGLLLMWAYQLQDFQLAGAPEWIGSERFDVAATLGRASDVSAGVDVVTGSSETMRAAVRTLLAERFEWQCIRKRVRCRST